MKPVDPMTVPLPPNLVFQPNPPGAPAGLYVIQNWITEQEAQAIVDFVCLPGPDGKHKWSDHISTKRPTQHYGYRYEISGYAASQEKVPLDWGVLRYHADKIEQNFPGVKIAQCLANLYFKDSTIGAHRDRETPMVFGISLVGDINMIWTDLQGVYPKYEALVPRLSMYIMMGDAATRWEHQVPGRATVQYFDSQGKVLAKLSKTDNYARVSITYRHFVGNTGPDRFARNNINTYNTTTTPNTIPEQINLPALPINPNLQSLMWGTSSSNTTNNLINITTTNSITSPSYYLVPGLEACHLKNVVPKHAEKEPLLFAEHAWVTMKSRYGSNLSRRVAYESHVQSRTSGIYAKWVELFCWKVLGIKVVVFGGFANLYSNGNCTLPAHPDQYGCWIFGLSFGQTRTFDFIRNGVGSNTKTSSNAGDIIPLEMTSGDILLFSPEVNNTHKHRILAQPDRTGRRINITYFIRPEPGQDTRRFINPPPLTAQLIPTFEEAEYLYQNSTPMGLPSSRPESRLLNQNQLDQHAIILDEQDDGTIIAYFDGISVPFASVDEALLTLAQQFNQPPVN